MATKKDDLQKKLEKKMGDIRLQTKEEEVKNLAKKLNLPFVNLKTYPVNTDALNTIEEGQARIAQMAVISKSGNNLKIAVRDSNNAETQVVLKNLVARKFTFDLVITSLSSLEEVWKRYKSSEKIKMVQLGVVDIKEEQMISLQDKIENIKDLKDGIAKLRVTDILDILIAGALKIGASDIHLEPEEKQLRIRYRLDGLLSNITELPNKEYSRLLSRIKLMSGLKINIHKAPQDGRFTIRLKKKDIEVRISVLPGAYGENVVMRILDPETIKQKLEDLGMRNDTLGIIKKELEKTTGAMLITGPTGSGKTTTLYAFIRHINKEGTKTITIEDPIEYHIKNISQTQVDEAKGYSFASGLRSIMRQDPDVILIGEIRDIETAEIAIQAALTGHLVFSTLHTNDAAGTIPRLIDLGVRPVNIAPAINLSVAQRLVRQLCPNCKEDRNIDAKDLELIKKSLANLPGNISVPDINDNTKIFYPQKCEECNNLGYKGRVGVFELFLVDDEMEKLISSSPSIPEINSLAVKKGMVTMLQDGYLKVLQGATSMEEVKRVLS